MGDIFSAIGILLVFATVALDFFVKEVQTFDKKTIPDAAQIIRLKEYRQEKYSIIYKLLGVFVFYLILFWLLIPKSVEIFKTSRFDIWDFNVISTFYVFINFCILIFIVLTLKYIIQTSKK